MGAEGEAETETGGAGGQPVGSPGRELLRIQALGGLRQGCGGGQGTGLQDCLLGVSRVELGPRAPGPVVSLACLRLCSSQMAHT